MEYRFPKNPIHGFTLVEILVALTILIIIAAIIFEGFFRYAHTQRFESIVSEIRNDIALQRQRTLASYDDTVYGVYVGTSSLQFFTGATPVVGSSANKIILFSTYNITATTSLKNNVWYSTFQRLSGAPSATGTITIFDTKSTASTTFTILRTGIIE
jgi:prepilin-type N-terminal cleavage/methylation domain-containing protein